MLSKLYKNLKPLFHLLWNHSSFGKGCANYHEKLIMHSFFSSHLRCNMWQWKRLLVLEKFENELCTASLWQNGIQECSGFIYSETTQTYCEEMKKTLGLAGCLCMWSKPRSGFFLLSSQGT